MSNYKAIATVTAVLRNILEDSQKIIDKNDTVADASIVVKTSSPAKLDGSFNNGAGVLNLFLYRITYNPACCNLNSPTRTKNGQPLIVKPTIALDLHYILTASAENDLKAQLMLSKAMITLHENSLIPKDKITETILKPKSADKGILERSNLDTQVASLKINLHILPIEELTKIWSSFFQTDYQLSVAYKVGVVLLESDLEPVLSLPVSKRQLHVVPIKQPVIEKIEPQIMLYNSAKNLIISGRYLSNDKVLVRIDDKEIEAKNQNLSENQISIDFADLKVNDVLAGIKQVQILQKIRFDENDQEGHKGSASNIAVFMLSPNLKNATSNNGKLTLDFEPGITEHQKVHILIGDYQINYDPTKDPEGGYPRKKISIDIPDDILTDIIYPVQLRVDNASSSIKEIKL